MSKSQKEIVTFKGLLSQAIRTQRGYDKAVASLSGSLLELAKKCADVAEFKRECQAAEAWLNTPDAGDLMLGPDEPLPRAWVNPKSNIAAGMGHGLDLTQYKTESSLRKEVMALNKAAKEGAGSPANETATPASGSDEPKPTAHPTIDRIVGYLGSMTEHGSARCLKEMERVAKKHYDQHLNSLSKEDREALTAKRAATSG